MPGAVSGGTALSVLCSVRSWPTLGVASFSPPLASGPPCSSYLARLLFGDASVAVVVQLLMEISQSIELPIVICGGEGQ